MIAIRCTRKLLDRIGPMAVEDDPPPPSNALGDWYANLLYSGRDQLVMATSEKSFLTVLLPARELRKRDRKSVV